jgi:L-alanine-DL-glutamate epimerase-like enolase superfamily enzyme
VSRRLEKLDPLWIEEPFAAYDAEAYVHLARSLETAIAPGEMLTSVAEHRDLGHAAHLGAALAHEPWVEHFDWLHLYCTRAARDP